MAETQWKIAEPTDPNAVAELQKQLGIREDIAQLLENRGVANFESARQFFRPTLEELHDPFLMQGMDKAVARLEQALGDGEKIMVFGDYDVDGTTSVALVYSFLKDLGHIDFYIPDRYKEGYGLSIAGIDYAKENGFGLMIVLDCGVKAVEKVAHANKLGIDIIICDHHLPGSELPAAIAVLDPKQDGCNYPYKELCGCGVGFKLLQAFCQKNGEDMERLFQKLDLVAIAIAADIVPMTGENRVLCSFGLEQINQNPSVGIRAMLAHAKISRALTISDVVFIIGPRINAAGRIASGKKAVELLISDNAKEAEIFATRIGAYNIERRALDKSVTEHALQLIEEDDFYTESNSTVVFHKDWHKGVVGIVASRIIENHYKPTIVLTESEGMATGSARSVSGFDVHAALCQCEDILEQFGGHKYAAGMSLKAENVVAFRDRFEQVVSESITEEMLIRKLKIDLEIDLDRITPKFMSMLKQFAPFGPQNLNPLFVSRNLKAEDIQLMGADRSHLRLKPKQKNVRHFPLQAVAFRMGNFYDRLMAGERFDLAYSIEENHWKDRVSLQLNVKGIKFV
ncbi:MAG: single-stranded-DNA-specific exonuclease RecJ [Flavobacteriales bacterium]|nr:single-stranded-DNA-specific exonuclease RecJ [Flavobacteriales bacterium]